MAVLRGSDSSKRLCAVLGHELRNPLASAVTNVSLASAMMDDNDPRSEHLRQALGDLERLSSLLSTYLEFGRGAEVSRRSIDTTEVVRAVVSRNEVAQARIEVDHAPVSGDAELLGRALENMIENAVVAGATQVRIELTSRDGAVVIDVVDNGPGVDTTVAETLFEPFVSGRGSSGLGLAVARDVVEQTGGRVYLRDTRRGAAFQIILPLATRPTVDEPAMPVL